MFFKSYWLLNMCLITSPTHKSYTHSYNILFCTLQLFYLSRWLRVKNEPNRNVFVLNEEAGAPRFEAETLCLLGDSAKHHAALLHILCLCHGFLWPLCTIYDSYPVTLIRQSPATACMWEPGKGGGNTDNYCDSVKVPFELCTHFYGFKIL